MDNLDLLPFAQQIKKKTIDGVVKTWDPIRRKYLVLTPEEMVRQCIILYLLANSTISKNHISAEKAVKTSHRQLRFDLLIYTVEGAPIMLIECKAPSVPITQLTFDQIANYNSVLQVPYLWISNGHDNRICKIDWETKAFEYLDNLPSIFLPATT